ncbi:MAG: hypothetical protein QM802_17585 [Agriterribacter sp.]
MKVVHALPFKNKAIEIITTGSRVVAIKDNKAVIQAEADLETITVEAIMTAAEIIAER